METIRLAKTRLIDKHPRFTAAVFGLIFMEVPGLEEKALGPIGVDKWGRCYYDPKSELLKHPLAVAEALVHEIWHVLRNHAALAESLNLMSPEERILFNVAADMAINDDIELKNLSKIFKPVLPSDYGLPYNLTAMEYYEKLKKLESPLEWKLGIASGQCGGCAGNPSEAESLLPPPPPMGEREVELKKMRVEVAQAIKQRGTMSAQERMFVEGILEPKIPWLQHLRGAVKACVGMAKGNTHRTFSRLHRKQSFFGEVIMPSRYKPLPKVGVVLDSSGSMSPEEHKNCLAELSGLLKTLCAQISVYVTDASVTWKGSISSAQSVELLGGGGTDMRVGLVEAAKENPDLVVVFTDGYTPWPLVKPSKIKDVIIVLTGSGQRVPEWARSISME